MSCMNCMESYGFWRKERGCAACDRLYCTKCITKKADVKGRKELVCNACFHRITATPLPDVVTVEASVGPRLGQLRGPGDLPPPSFRGQSSQPPPPSLHRGRDDDSPPVPVAELENRLNALKASQRRPAPAQAELEGRLADLKEVPLEIIQGGAGPLPPPAPHKTATEESGDLLTQMRDEAALEARLGHPPGTTAHLEERLARLRGRGEDEKGPPDQPTLDSDPPKVTDASEAGSAENGDEASKSDAEVVALLEAAGREAEAEAKAALESLAKDESIARHLAQLRQDTKEAEEAEADLSRALSRRWAGGKAEAEERELDSGAEEEEDEGTKRVVAAAIAEAELEARMEQKEGGKKGEWPRKEAGERKEGSGAEQSWCSVCADDAALVCNGCGGGLFCRRCYREGHSREQMIGVHRWSSLQPARKAASKETDV